MMDGHARIAAELLTLMTLPRVFFRYGIASSVRSTALKCISQHWNKMANCVEEPYATNAPSQVDFEQVVEAVDRVSVGGWLEWCTSIVHLEYAFYC